MPDPMTVFSIVTFALDQIQFFADLTMDGIDTSHDQVMAKLDEIQLITTTTQNGVHELLVAMDSLADEFQLAEAETKLWVHFNKLCELKNHTRPENQYDTWAAAVVDFNIGSANALNIIHYQIVRNNAILKFKNKAEAAARNKRLSRSVLGSTIDFFKLYISYEILGFIMLQEANHHLQEWEEMNYEYRVMIQRFNEQIKQFKIVADSMPETSYFKNEELNNHYFNMGEVINVRTTYEHPRRGGPRRVRTNMLDIYKFPIEADIGNVITGVQLYTYYTITHESYPDRYGNIALKIKQGRLRKDGRIDSQSWKDVSGRYDFRRRERIQIYNGNEFRVCLNSAKAPKGKALVGISLYKKGNCLAIQVQVASVDYINGNIYGSPQWIKSPEGGQTYNYDWKYLDSVSVETNPPSMLTAAAFYRKNNNRLAIQVCDVFEPDVQGNSCEDYSFVKMIESDCCHGYPYKRYGSGISTATIPTTTLTTIPGEWRQKNEADCWYECGSKDGSCPTFCGTDGFCCRKGYGGCPAGAAEASPEAHHACVIQIGPSSRLKMPLVGSTSKKTSRRLS